MKCGVVGATGYLGAELMRLLADHPVLDVAVAQADSTTGSKVGELYPALGRAYRDLVVEELDIDSLERLDVVFVALPSGHSQQVVSSLVGKVQLVVDLGADFRLRDPAAYPRWYGFEHSVPELLAKAVYGLVELNRAALDGAELIAAPGCYVTAAALALQPLVGAGLLQPSGIIVDGASGTSGAGKSPAANLHHPLANERFAPYGLLDHRHTPEMEQVIGAQLLFTPHLAPMTRGILATCYARPAGGADLSTAGLIATLGERYSGDPFVNVTAGVPSTADAYGSNVVHLTARVDDRTGWVIVIAAIDNLVKGGSGQAIQAANVALRLPESAGLPLAGLSP
ncbi:MAG: N-acetyl-gamma-glutamyl-phosphate reductase [Acidimicrobiales bacterium]|jgi:N-acetyl-gamma-glutamyl-phosphate reductase